MSRLRIAAVLLLLLIASRAWGASRVGFRVIRALDSSRTFAGGSRPVQVSLWYPAAPTRAGAITYREYLRDLGTEGTRSAAGRASSRGAVKEFTDYARQLGVTSDAIQGLLAQRFKAVRGAPMQSGRYPLVVMAVGRDESPVLHVALAEALAARGYVVASVPTMGSERREMGFDLISLETATRDLEYAMQVAFSQAGIDRKRVAAVGYSYGSGPALLLAMKTSAVTALVSVDGSIAFADRAALFRSSPLFDTARACVPLLHINVLGEARNDLSTIDQMKCSTRIVVSLAGANHFDFSIFGAATGMVSGFEHGVRGTTAESQARSHAVMTRLVGTFLERVFRGEDLEPILDTVRSPDSISLHHAARGVRTGH